MTSYRPSRTVRLVTAIMVALALFAVIRAVAIPDAGALRAMGVSAIVALALGGMLLVLSVLGLLRLAEARAPGASPPPEPTETDLAVGRARLYSLATIAAMGLTLILLSLAGPALPPPLALGAVLALSGVMTGLTLATWRLLDELTRALSRETGNAAFYLMVVIGGGWAALAHLGFARAPAPLDWLTMFTLIMLAASVIAVGRRGLL